MAVLLLAGAAVSPSYAADTVYTREQVAAHATGGDCWSFVRDIVYDLTHWVLQHPHGDTDILGMCGKDGTEGFEGEHIGNQSVFDILKAYQVGYLPEAAPVPTPTPSVTATPTATPSASAKPAARPARATITCVKGKQVKKVAATKCPSGWKKK